MAGALATSVSQSVYNIADNRNIPPKLCRGDHQDSNQENNRCNCRRYFTRFRPTHAIFLPPDRVFPVR